MVFSVSVILGTWSAGINDNNQFIKVVFSSFIRLTGIATQGYTGYRQYVTSYKIMYLNKDGVLVTYQNVKVFKGNIDDSNVVYNAVDPSITTKEVRVAIESWNNWCAMRLELYGCGI